MVVLVTYQESQLKKLASLALIAVGFSLSGIGVAAASPASVQREGGPCYEHEYGMDSADGTLFCSPIGLYGSWQSKAETYKPKVALGDRCVRLGDRAFVKKTDGRATCRETSSGLRWQ
ncbi:hypothetical protein HH308_01425 [Gordonia sp. TBRC 11910]|uniref:Uncharacterized protein n=1 Tax=Gordonia asplenii TaxID=2725283 RepID=A0A848KL98_9ACTN|nr:hypothetical protein [Gordonia asplenii]NMN99873.1 hypothetical protein [Gordonia asplenii]